MQQSKSTAASPRPSPPAVRTPGRRGLAILLTIVVLAIAVNLTTRWLGLFALPTPAVAPTMVTFQPATAGLACLADLAWSPDGARIAVAGETGGCPTSATPTPPSILIYDGHTGVLLQRLDASAALRSAGALGTTQAVLVTQVLWSPNGAQLALTFDELAADATTGASQVATSGIIVLDLSGQAPLVIMQPTPANSATSATTAVAYDLTTRQATTLAAATNGATLPPALSYRWDGQSLVAADALDATNLGGAIGSPVAPDHPVSSTGSAGGNGFSIWQPGTLNQYTQGGPGMTFASPVTTWEMHTVAWSPAGTTIIAPIAIALRVQAPGAPAPSADALAWLGDIPFGPIRDAGMGAIATSIAAASPSGGTSSAGNARVAVAWRPDGTLVAAYGIGFTPVLSMYSTATGKLVTSLNAPVDSSPIPGSDPLIRWSPDGQRFVLSTADSGTVAIYHL